MMQKDNNMILLVVFEGILDLDEDDFKLMLIYEIYLNHFFDEVLDDKLDKEILEYKDEKI
jgi:hypothetical protein